MAKISGVVFVSMLQRQMEDESLEESIKTIHEILKNRLRIAKNEQKREVEGYDFVDEIEDKLTALNTLAGELDIDLDD